MNNPSLAILLADGYKLGHHKMYPKGTVTVFNNLTPRSNKYAPHLDMVAVFGIQMAVKMIDEIFEKEFFKQPKEEVVSALHSTFSEYLMADYDVKHFEALHDLGYLPICKRALANETP